MANRCDDCLGALGEDRYAVLKENHDVLPELALSPEPFVAALAKWRQTFVCEDCAGWYGDHAIRVTAIEAGS